MTLRIGSISLEKDQPVEALSGCIARMGADVLLVSGFRTGMRGMLLRAGLDRLGLVYQTPCDTEPETETLILGSKIPFLQVEIPDALESHRHHYLHVCIGDFHLMGSDLTGLPSPSTLKPHVMAQAERLRRDKLIFFSRCAPKEETLSAPLTRLGFLDAYQLPSKAGEKKRRQGEEPPFKALVTPALAPQLSSCFQDSPPSDTQQAHTAVLKVG